MAQTAAPVAPSRVTPETLRPEPGPPPAITLPNGAPLQVPPQAANLSVTVGQFEVDGTFPEFQNQTAVLIGALRGTRMTVAQIYGLAARIEQAYAAAGYVLARVVVPAQDSAAMNQQNAVGTLAAYTDGTNASFSFVNTTALAVGPLTTAQAGVQADSNGFPIATPMAGAPSDPLAGITTANGGVSLTVENSGTLAINQPIAAGTGSVTAASSGNLTIGASGAVSGNAVTLATLGNFTNDAGSTALNASSQWLVYSTQSGE